MSGTFRILGCGSSGGVPRLPDDWGACDPTNPRNARRRCSALVSRTGPGGTTRVLIDTSPDLRMQLLDAGVGVVDAVLYTHSHADHVHGIDDLRLIVFNTRRKLPVWADEPTCRELLHRFDYIFETPPGSGYPPLCDLHRIEGPVTVDGPGGPLTFVPFTVEHGTIPALGFRMGGLAYLPDVSTIPGEVWPALGNLDCWVLDGLRYKPHPTHAHLAQSLEWIARAAPRTAVITNMHVDLDYGTLLAELPQGVVPAHDGLEIVFDP